MDVEVLSAKLRGQDRNYYVECTKERWNEVMAPFSDKARRHAANMAAHSYDVLVVDGRVMLAQPSMFCSDVGPNFPHWLTEPDYTTCPSFPHIDDEQFISQLYENRGRYKGHKRLFIKD